MKKTYKLIDLDCANCAATQTLPQHSRANCRDLCRANS